MSACGWLMKSRNQKVIKSFQSQTIRFSIFPHKYIHKLNQRWGLLIYQISDHPFLLAGCKYSTQFLYMNPTHIFIILKGIFFCTTNDSTKIGRRGNNSIHKLICNWQDGHVCSTCAHEKAMDVTAIEASDDDHHYLDLDFSSRRVRP